MTLRSMERGVRMQLLCIMDMDLVKNITMRTKYEAADIEDMTVALKGISKMSFQ